MTDAAALLDSQRRIYLVATGAGAGLQKMLWDVPGISRVLVGAEFPYAPEATDRFLGFTPDNYCSARTAISLAMEAYYLAYRPGGAPAVGLGLTGSVASLSEHRGEHRVVVATVSDSRCWCHIAVLPKGGDDARARDGAFADGFGLRALLQATNQEEMPVVVDGVLRCASYECSVDAMALLLGRPLFTVAGKRELLPEHGGGLTLFPGAFNPPHEGHLWMAAKHSATFHVTINPPHKPSLSVAEVLQRAKLLDGFARIFTKDDPLYIDKARRFPGARFLVGVDALARLLDPKWGVPIDPMVQEFRQLDIWFLVADRRVDGKIVTLHDLNAPPGLCKRIILPAEHLSLSSTRIRGATARAAP